MESKGCSHVKDCSILFLNVASYFLYEYLFWKSYLSVIGSSVLLIIIASTEH